MKNDKRRPISVSLNTKERDHIDKKARSLDMTRSEYIRYILVKR